MKVWRMALTVTIAVVTTMTVQAETVLHVARDGQDSNPGSCDRPLASLAGARNRVRQVKADGEPVTVIFAAGTYRFEKPVTFEKRDSGSKGAPIMYRSAAGVKVRFTGGRSVTEWHPVTDPGIRRRLSEDGRDHVRVADLRAQGITDFGKLAERGFNRGSPLAEAELFFSDEPMTLARWPNEGFRSVVDKQGIEKVVIDTDRLARWVDESDPWIFAYWYHDWAELYEPIIGIDAERRILMRSPDSDPQGGLDPKRARWYAFNLLAELDRPGEYYLDRESGGLYFWPPSADGSAVVSQADGFIRAIEVSHVAFRGFTFEACRATAIHLQGGADCHIVGCTLRNTGHGAVTVVGGVDHEVYGCDIYDCGEEGINMNGGDRPSLTPARHNAENNHVHGWSRRVRTYKAAVRVYGVGCRIAHNLIHDGPHMALSAGGNDHVIEYNEIHNVVYECGDAGAFYVGRDWTQRGTILRHNYWHHVAGATGTHHGGMTIYLDDQHSGHTIHGNLFERCSRAVFIGGGDDNKVTNNVFIDCPRAAHIDNRGMVWQKQFTDDLESSINTMLRAMPYKNPEWQERYPTLAAILDDDPGVPKRNVFRCNISAGGRWDDIHAGTRHLQTIEDNLVFDDQPDWIRLVKDDQGKPVRLDFQDPVAVAAIGFEALLLTKMGVYKDERRASWPVRQEVQVVVFPNP